MLNLPRGRFPPPPWNPRRGVHFGHQFLDKKCSMPSSEARKTYLRAYRTAYRARHRRVSVSLTGEEYARIEQAAKAQKERPTTYLKTAAFAYLNKGYSPPPELVERLDTLVFLLRNVATNINQIARASNEIHAVLDRDQVFAELARLEQVLRTAVETPPNPP